MPAFAALRSCCPARTRPMHTVFTRIWCGANSFDSALVNASPAARVTVVGIDLARGCLAPILVMLTMRPPPCRFMCGIARRASRIAAKSLSSKSACQMSSVTDSNSPVAEVPALLTRMSSRPNALTASATSFAQSSARLTSACTAATLPPAARISSATLSSNSRPRAAITTLAPSAASRNQGALPMPCEPPVTIATLSFSSKSIGFLRCSKLRSFPIPAPADCTAGAGLMHHDLRQQRQRRFKPVPDPLRQMLAGRVFQPRHLVQVAVVELFVQRLEHGRNIAEVLHPAYVRIDLPAHVDLDAGRMAVAARAPVP